MTTKLWYALAIHEGQYEEYLMSLQGDDCFTDDIGQALLFSPSELLPVLDMNEYMVRVEESEEGYIRVIGKGDTAEVIRFTGSANTSTLTNI